MSFKLPTFDWDETIQSIEDAGCVLLAGPELMRYKNQPVHLYLREHLNATNKGEDIEFYYPQESLFLFSGKSAKIRVKRKAKDLLHQLWTDPHFISENTETLQMLAQLPVHLIISVTPDKFISGTLATYRIPHRTGFFVGGDKEIKPVAEPSMHEPLVYNLCGSVDDHESIILDYEDLYKYLKTVLDRSRLPEILVKTLQKADKFIFLGFELEKWHTQLLIQLLMEVIEDREKYATKPHYSNDNFKRFFEGQFNITPLPETIAFLRELHEKFRKKYPSNLRNTDRKSSTHLAIIEQYIVENDFVNALNELEIFARHDSDKNSIILLKSQYQDFQKEKETLHPETRAVQRNKLANSILELANEILREL